MKPQFIFAIVFAVLVGLSFVTGNIDPYFYTIIIFIGINITMATSLNLINGFTGQFSLGHAGFMGVGAYVSAIASTYLTTHGMSGTGMSADVILLIALLCG
ncbi:MAG TPA: branched-chain amino acid ABC transporter permease, partial [Candidatus Kapabacteria bacterium]|nr:branched-chain amino acid ABC transporter permease [Candidatus Kapabacteria bacterium]